MKILNKHSLSLIGILFLLFENLSCGGPSSQEEPFLQIAIVGDAIPTQNAANAPYYGKSRAYGPSLWEGVNAAFGKSPRLNNLRNKIILKGYDDGGREDNAQEIAIRISNNPNIIGVIGHSSSQTTKIAAPLYSAVSLPLLMPVASSPYVFNPNEEIIPSNENTPSLRLKNLFRLPPNDKSGQSPAIGYAINSIYKDRDKPKIALIQDISPDTPVYTKPIFDELNKFLDKDKLIIIRRAYSYNDDITLIAKNIRLQNINLVVFIGYGTQAQSMIAALRNVYKDVKPEERPNIFLTDGCKIPDLDTTGFNTYISFPVPQLFSPSLVDEENLSNKALTNNTSKIVNNNTGSVDFQALKDTMMIDGRFQESYQMFGYDAMLFLGEAIQRCDDAKTISRTCVLRELSSVSEKPFKGVHLSYSFREGENNSPYYYIYKISCLSEVVPIQKKQNKEDLEKLSACYAAYTPFLEISPSDIQNFLENFRAN